MNIDKLIDPLPPGHFNRADITFMLTLLPKVNEVEGVYLEVGSLLGRSSILIGKEAEKAGEKLYCVDVWDREEWLAHRKTPPCPTDILGTFLGNIKQHGLKETVIAINKESELALKAWNEYFKEPLRFIHVDGCHDYEAVLIDTGWKKHLSLGGIICFHDYCDSAPGVIRAVNEELVMDGAFVKVDIRHSLIAFKRVKLRAPCSHNGDVHKK